MPVSHQKKGYTDNFNTPAQGLQMPASAFGRLIKKRDFR